VTDQKDSSLASEGTRVDLGEDLLEQDPHASFILPSAGPESVQSLFESAKILMREGMLEEAKKIIHQILSRDSKFAAANGLLKEIHQKELEQIFNQERTRKVYRKDPDREGIDFNNINSSELMDKLDRELNLGISVSPSFFSDSESLEVFYSHLETELAGAPPQDRVDLGIGFLETGLFELAIRLFQQAAQSWGEAQDPRMASGIALLALAQLLAGKPFDSLMTLQPAINDSEIPLQSRIEIFYLTARAHEALDQPDQARDWYQKTAALDLYYRDVSERIKIRNPR